MKLNRATHQTLRVKKIMLQDQSTTADSAQTHYSRVQLSKVEPTDSSTEIDPEGQSLVPLPLVTHHPSSPSEDQEVGGTSGQSLNSDGTPHSPSSVPLGETPVDSSLETQSRNDSHVVSPAPSNVPLSPSGGQPTGEAATQGDDFNRTLLPPSPSLTLGPINKPIDPSSANHPQSPPPASLESKPILPAAQNDRESGSELEISPRGSVPLPERLEQPFTFHPTGIESEAVRQK